MEPYRSRLNCLIDASVNGSPHVGKRLVKFLFELVVLSKLVEEEGPLDCSKLFSGPFSEQMVKETCHY